MCIRDRVRAYFADIARRGYQVEVNTKAYHDLVTFYPNERYFSYLHDLGVRVDVYKRQIQLLVLRSGHLGTVIFNFQFSFFNY